jgi:asparagine synthase (glutamine-hydrolysing)
VCGIGGIIKLDNSSVNLAEAAQTISETLRHRGPDDEGYLFFGNSHTLCTFGSDTQERVKTSALNFAPHIHVSEAGTNHNAVFIHRRLAIIDVNEGGHQPMCSPDETVWVTYNGEIYNYIELRQELEKAGRKFNTQSDTEVLLNGYLHWGEDCLQKLDGMFAFCLWDKTNNRIFCARDRSGVKPFYYYYRNGIFSFASELKALRKLPCIDTSLNERALHHYLVYDALEYEEESFLKNIFELKPAHSLSLGLNYNKQPALKKYELFQINEDLSKKESAWIEKTRPTTIQAIERHLRSDVAVGCCLSGGLDSSVISGVIAKRHKDFNAFTAIFPGDKADESKYAKEVVQFTGAKWHTTEPQQKELLTDFEELIYALDIPIWSTSTYAQFRVMQLAKQNKIKVVLDGQGGDELFAGYPHYITTYANQLLRAGKWSNAFAEIHAIGLTRTYLKENIKRAIDYNSNKKYLRNEFVNAQTKPEGWQLRFNSLNEHLFYDFYNHRLKTYLRCEDRCSMHHSVESRTPFADDNELIRLAFTVPASLKIKKGTGKYILREALKDFLPEAVYSRTDKMGFVTPHNKWLPGLLAKYRDLLQNPYLAGILTPHVYSHLDHLLAKNDQLQKSPTGKEETFLFKILVLSQWTNAFSV